MRCKGISDQGIKRIAKVIKAQGTYSDPSYPYEGQEDVTVARSVGGDGPWLDYFSDGAVAIAVPTGGDTSAVHVFDSQGNPINGHPYYAAMDAAGTMASDRDTDRTEEDEGWVDYAQSYSDLPLI